MTGRVNIASFLAVTFTTVLAATVAAVSLPHDPYVRYQSFSDTIFGRLGWIYERIFFDPTPIDVLVIGSSRAARGANAAALEQALAERGRDLHVANLSMPASGFDARMTVVRDTIRQHDVKLVIWSVVEAFPRDGHQVFGDLATAGEVLRAPWIVNRNLPGNLARLPYRQMEYWLATILPEAFGHRAEFDPQAYPGPVPDHRRFNEPDWTPATDAAITGAPDHADTLAAESRQRKWEITKPILPEALSWIEFGVSRHYIRELTRLGEAEGFGVAFLFQPFYEGFEAPIEAATLTRAGPLWIADFMRTDAQNYIDAGHASQIGQDRLVPWLADQIAAEVPLN